MKIMYLKKKRFLEKDDVKFSEKIRFNIKPNQTINKRIKYLSLVIFFSIKKLIKNKILSKNQLR